MIDRALLLSCLAATGTPGTAPAAAPVAAPVCTAAAETGAAGAAMASRLCAAALALAPDGRFAIEVTRLTRTSLSARLTPAGATAPGPELSVGVMDLDHLPDSAIADLARALLTPPPDH